MHNPTVSPTPTEEWYADVIVPLAMGALTFWVPHMWQGALVPGSRVVVPLGARKHYTGIIARLHRERPCYRQIKPIAEVTDPQPVVTAEQLKLWEWMASYYMAPLGLVMRAALPAGLKSSGFSSAEALRGGYHPREIAWVRLHPRIDTQEKLHHILDALRRAKVQHRVVIELLTLSPFIAADQQPNIAFAHGIERSALSASGAILKTLVQKKILEVVMREPLRAEPGLEMTDSSALRPILCGRLLPQLTPVQLKALEEIRVGFKTRATALLHGITGSGKTEIYLHLMAAALEKGENVLYLLPEIALTTQLIERIALFFPNSVVVYHSRLSDNRRAALYGELLKVKRGQIILGVRSSVLLPTPNLSLVIVDEEHENTFKQSESAPRYHARDTAMVLASLYGAHTLLGSATPSLESYYNGLSGKYTLVTLNERYGGVALPRVMVSDTLRAAKRGEKRSHFNGQLLEQIDTALGQDRQVILFQNRRGFSPYIECGNCGWTASCPHCNVSLTYHKTDGSLRCHYCGCQTPIPSLCPSCSAADLLPRGFGTEKIEEELQVIFPDARIDRLDADSTRSARSYQRIISDFEQGRTNILVGTQMITKGFDFDRVALVGILNADNLLNYPDFRASERAFQLMTQVAGRAGRREERGTVIIQTAQPTHPIIGQVCRGEYEVMAGAQLAERQSFLYPPYCRLIALTFRHRDKTLLWRSADEFAQAARKTFGRRLLGPEAPPIDRVREQYLVRFLLKIEKQRSVQQAKFLLQELCDNLKRHPDYKSIDILPDVDPL